MKQESKVGSSHARRRRGILTPPERAETGGGRPVNSIVLPPGQWCSYCTIRCLTGMAVPNEIRGSASFMVAPSAVRVRNGHLRQRARCWKV